MPPAECPGTRRRLKTRGHAAGLERISLVGGSSIPTTTKEILSLMGHTPPQRPRANHSVPKLVPLVGCDWPMANDHHTVAHVLRIIPELQQVKPLPPATGSRCSSAMVGRLVRVTRLPGQKVVASDTDPGPRAYRSNAGTQWRRVQYATPNDGKQWSTNGGKSRINWHQVALTHPGTKRCTKRSTEAIYHDWE